MLSTKPYLIRAIYEWCTDQGFTPYLAVQVDERTRVPREFVRDGQIVLNVSPTAAHQMRMANDEIAFQARFNGVSFSVALPVDSVLAIYARENGQGMVFEPNPAAAGNDGDNDAKVGVGETAEESTEPGPKRGSHLTRIK